MTTRTILLFVLALGLAACGGQGGGRGDSMPRFLDQSEAPPAPPPPSSLENAPDVAAEGEETEAAVDPEEAPEPTRVRNRDLDPANTEALDSERVICEEKGGRWSRAGSSGGFACVFNTRDANKQCTAASQCEGYCLARSGTCAPVNPLFGCHEIKTDSGRTQKICIN